MSNIPCIIINFNRLTTTEKLVDQLLILGYSNVSILDMDSTYEPLIEWYNSCTHIKVIRWQNTGHKALWIDGILRDQFSQYPWVVVSDSDIELSPETPTGFIEQMITVAKDYRGDKIGLSIRIDDISNPVLRDIVTPIESRYWGNRLQHPIHEIYYAPVDSTFCIVKPELLFTYDALRLADWPIKHCDWYSNWDNLTTEEQYYMDHADETIATTKQHYMNWKKQQI